MRVNEVTPEEALKESEWVNAFTLFPGLPNAGIDYYISQPVLDGVSATGKPYIVSLSGARRRLPHAARLPCPRSH